MGKLHLQSMRPDKPYLIIFGKIIERYKRNGYVCVYD